VPRLVGINHVAVEVVDREETVAALEWSLIGPCRKPSAFRPAFTVASMALAILSRNALMCSSFLPETDSSFAIMTWAMERLFCSA
jgi:hypothetical protein